MQNYFIVSALQHMAAVKTLYRSGGSEVGPLVQNNNKIPLKEQNCPVNLPTGDKKCTQWLKRNISSI